MLCRYPSIWFRATDSASVKFTCGQASYRANVEMLSGNSVIGPWPLQLTMRVNEQVALVKCCTLRHTTFALRNILFTDAFIDLHSVEEVHEIE